MDGSTLDSAPVLRSDALIKDKTRLRIDLQDIKLFDGELGSCLQKAPAEYLPLVRHCTPTQA